jgi:hypothetical protein
VESLAAIDVLDLDDPATAPPYSIDRMDAVTPITNEPTFDDLGHRSPLFFLYRLEIGHHLSADQVQLVAIS